MTGDGTTTSVLFTGELLRQAERYLSEGLHPRVLTEGFELAKEHALELLDTFRSTRQEGERERERGWSKFMHVDISISGLMPCMERVMAATTGWCEIDYGGEALGTFW